MSVYSHRRSSIFWALILIGVGALFLWHNFNPSVHPWNLIAKFWPVLIILWGVSRLFDYLQARAHPESMPSPLFSGGEIVLLVFLLILGTAVSKVVLRSESPWLWHINGDQISDFFASSYTFTKNISQPVEGAPRLSVEGQHGDVEIRGVDQSTIEGVAKESIRADDESEARKVSDALKFSVVDQAGRYLLQSNRRELVDQGRRISIDLSLTAPLATSTDLASGNGDLSVDGLKGDQTLETQKGDARAANIQGLVKIREHDGSIEVSKIHGSVDLDGRGDDIDISDVSDSVTLHGEFGGTLEFRNIAESLRFDSIRTQMTVQQLAGRLDMEVGSLEASDVNGPFEISTRDKDITITDFKQALSIVNSNGQITLATSLPPTHDIHVDSKKGEVQLTLPPNSNFEIEAYSRHGEVECDFTGPGLKVVKEGDSPSITGVVGKGGPKIRIDTEYGAIRIYRTGSHPAPKHDDDDDDDQPKPAGKSQAT
jgi:hypothetical protein